MECFKMNVYTNRVYKNLDIFFSIKCQHKNNILKNAFIKLAESFSNHVCKIRFERVGFYVV